MVALFLLFAAGTVPDSSPPRQSCIRAVGSEIVLCGTPPGQSGGTPLQGTYRLPRLAPQTYGPVLPSAQSNLGHGVRATLRGQTSNSGRGRRNQSTATLSVPF